MSFRDHSTHQAQPNQQQTGKAGYSNCSFLALTHSNSTNASTQHRESPTKPASQKEHSKRQTFFRSYSMQLRIVFFVLSVGGSSFLALTQAFAPLPIPNTHVRHPGFTKPSSPWLTRPRPDDSDEDRRQPFRFHLFSTRTVATPTSAYFYQVLGVNRDSTIQQIKSAYRKLAKELHPDANRDALYDTTARFQDVNRAYEAVLEEVRRREEEAKQAMEQQTSSAASHHPFTSSPAPSPAQRQWSATTNRYASKRPSTSSAYHQYYEPPPSQQRSSTAPRGRQSTQPYRRSANPYNKSWHSPSSYSNPTYNNNHHRSPSPVQPNFVNVHPARETRTPHHQGRGTTSSRPSYQQQRSYFPMHDTPYTSPPAPAPQREWKVDFKVNTERRPIRRGIMERIFQRGQRFRQEPPDDVHYQPPVVVGEGTYFVWVGWSHRCMLCRSNMKNCGTLDYLLWNLNVMDFADLSVDVWIDRPTAVKGGVHTVSVSHRQNSEETVRHITVTVPRAAPNDPLPTGHMFFVAGQGHPGPHGGPPGDLYIFLRVRG